MKTEEPVPEGGRACGHCGVSIDQYAHANRLYCCTACANKAYRERIPAGVETAKAMERRAKNPELHRVSNREYMRRLRIADVRRGMLSAAKARAKKQDLPFNLTLEDLGPLPEYCPVLGIPLEMGTGAWCAGSPSLDKIVPALGYTKGNVVIVSWRANRLKSDATVQEMRRLADYYEEKISSGGWMVPHAG